VEEWFDVAANLPAAESSLAFIIDIGNIGVERRRLAYFDSASCLPGKLTKHSKAIAPLGNRQQRAKNKRQINPSVDFARFQGTV
jgi:hypothetical protein